MSRQITVDYYCDDFEEDGEPKHEPRTVRGDTYLVYSPEKHEVVEVDVCDPCMDGMPFTHMGEIADKYGRQQTDAETNPNLVCPYTDCPRNTRPFKDEAGKHRHLTRTHGEEPRSKNGKTKDPEPVS